MKIYHFKIYSLFLFVLFLSNCENPIDSTQDTDDVEENCTLDYGGFIDECGLCSGGITDLDPNSSEDICGTCNGEATIENTTLLFYDYNGDDIEDTLCGCDGIEIINEDGCCGEEERDVCGICGGNGADTDGDDVCDVHEVLGCQDPVACNYNENATDGDESCIYEEQNCESCSGEVDGSGTVIDNNSDDDDYCDSEEGCLDVGACNYDENALDDNNSCVYIDMICDSCVEGEIIDNDLDNDGICDSVEIPGCQDQSACNYNDSATDSDDSCLYIDGLCETCVEGSIIDNDVDDDGVCNDVDECNVNTLPEGDCDCEENVLDQCGVCGGSGIAEGLCDCNGNVLDCANVCGGNAELDCANVCSGDAEEDECGVCEGTGIPQNFCDCEGTLIYDCNQDCGGTAYYNYCGYCVGGNTSLINSHGQDDCGVCNGGNQNIDFCGVCFGGDIACTQGLLTLTEWELTETQIWNNEECTGPVNHSYDDYICANEGENINCYDSEYEFLEDNSFILKQYQWIMGDDVGDPLIINGSWVMDYTSYPIIINGNSLCLDFLDGNEQLCYNSVELEKEFSNCEQDPSICFDNNLTLTYINGSQCVVSRFTSK